MNEVVLYVPEFNIKLVPGCRVRLGRFDLCTWVVQHGWYSWGGNRPFCGWYLQNVDHPEEVKPLQEPDLNDIYLVEI